MHRQGHSRPVAWLSGSPKVHSPLDCVGSWQRHRRQPLPQVMDRDASTGGVLFFPSLTP